MKLDAITNKNDEWYTPREAVLPVLKYLKPSSTIWCPFDTQESEYVKVLQQAGHNVIYTHIINGQDFFDYNIECDYIISNPPYSIKGGVIERLFALKRPFMMLLGCVGVFESQVRFEMFKDNGVELLIFNKRVKFDNPIDNKKLSPPFSSWYFCKDVLPQQIVFDYIEDNKRKSK